MEKKENIKFETIVYKLIKYSESDDKFIKERGIKYTNINKLIQALQKDEGYHFRIHNNTQYIFFGDIDKYTKTIEEFINNLQIFLKEYYKINFSVDDFKYTKNNKVDGSYHYSIPKFNASTEKLKEIHENFNKIHKKTVDTTVYSEHWYRCHNQKKCKYLGDKQNTS